MSAKILLPAILQTYRPRADKSFTLGFVTNEITPEQLLVINQLHNQHVYLMIKDSEIDTAERDMIDNVQPDFDNVKSLSHRLRNVLYVEFMQDPGAFIDFQAFYKYKMERAIDSVKSRLEPR